MPDEPKRFKLGEQEASPRAEEDGVQPSQPSNETQSTLSSESSTAAPQSLEDVTPTDVDRLGAALARALQDGEYHPVILFGTNFSGKTSLLLSLLSTLISEPQLEAGVVLCDPILGTESGTGRRLHEHARQLFEVQTQAFIEGEKIPATRLPLPFFIPVEVRPTGKPPMRFAFLESNGEWYRPLRERNQPLATAERLYPQLRTEIEDFVASFQGGISFIYLLPYTQGEVYADRDNPKDADEVQGASLAITGVLRAYDHIRANHRANDRHLMVVTKWDARTARETDRAEGILEDRAALDEFCGRRYKQAITAFQTLNVSPEQRGLNAYCSGLINERGLLQLRPDDDVREVVMAYPLRLWNWLYKNALYASDQHVVPLFPEPPEPPVLIRVWRQLLDFVSGR